MSCPVPGMEGRKEQATTGRLYLPNQVDAHSHDIRIDTVHVQSQDRQSIDASKSQAFLLFSSPDPPGATTITIH